ncbi:MAG TPA: stage II sporulation protein D [Firmicutes bacterium]|nr:stage II sporulation protein D [Candidatus Fermentithermobacillaceae bacterium]
MKKAILLLLFIAGLLLGVSTGGQMSDGGVLLPLPRPSKGQPFIRIDVYYVPQGKVVSLDLEEYVKGVVASEMPPTFHYEALKAQAVVARTYAVRKMKIFGGTPSRPDADVVSDHNVDQAWAPEPEIKRKWGVLFAWRYWAKVSRAVEETEGLILAYDGMPAEAVYHSTSAGPTEPAVDVWGRDVPYLRSVPCEFCSHSPYYNAQTVRIPVAVIAKNLSSLGTAVPVTQMVDAYSIVPTEISPTGRVKEVTVSGTKIRGLEFRKALGLKSTKVYWEVSGEDLVLTVRGYGHGVGMCQYGADGLARLGKTYLDILSYYYPGTQVVYIFDE